MKSRQNDKVQYVSSSHLDFSPGNLGDVSEEHGTLLLVNILLSISQSSYVMLENWNYTCVYPPGTHNEQTFFRKQNF